MDVDESIAIVIRSHHCEVPDDVRSELERKISRLQKYFTGLDEAEVKFTHETDHHRHGEDLELCEVVVRGRGQTVRASARAADVKTAAERVVDKLEANLTRLKSKLVQRSQPRRRASLH